MSASFNGRHFIWQITQYNLDDNRYCITQSNNTYLKFTVKCLIIILCYINFGVDQNENWPSNYALRCRNNLYCFMKWFIACWFILHLHCALSWLSYNVTGKHIFLARRMAKKLCTEIKYNSWRLNLVAAISLFLNNV